MKKEISIIKDSKRIRPTKSEVDRLLASNKLAKKYLKWSPKYKNKAGLILGLKKTIKWYEDEENLKFYNTEYSV